MNSFIFSGQGEIQNEELVNTEGNYLGFPSVRLSIHLSNIRGLVFLDTTLKRNDTKKKLQFICFWTEVLYFIQNSLASTELHLFREVTKPSCWFSNKCAVVFNIRQLGHTNVTQITAIKNILLFFSASK